MSVVQDLTSWPSKPVRRACVNSFGFGGANAHCIIDDSKSYDYRLDDSMSADVEQAHRNGSPQSLGTIVNGFDSRSIGQARIPVTMQPISSDEGVSAKHSQVNSIHRESTEGAKCTIQKQSATCNGEIFNGYNQLNSKTRRLVLLPFSAADDESLDKSVRKCLACMDKSNIADAAYTLAAGRSKFFKRRCVVVNSESCDTMKQGAAAIQGECLESRKTSMCFLFTGKSFIIP